MRMTEQEFRDECVYSATMSHVKTMLAKGLISEDEYWKINGKMKARYNPVSDGLLSENSLLCVRNRGLMVSGRRRENAENHIH